MVFSSPEWVPSLPFEPPDSVSLLDFLFDEKYGRTPLRESSVPFVCAWSGKSFSVEECRTRVELAAKGLATVNGWEPNIGSEWSKVVGIFSMNTIDYLTTAWATLRLGGVCCPISTASTVSEAIHHIKLSKINCIFTNIDFLDLVLEAAAECHISTGCIFLLDQPTTPLNGLTKPKHFLTFDQLIYIGKMTQKDLEIVRFQDGEGANRTAFCCSSSGTSGLPKSVMLSHQAVVANILMTVTFEARTRDMLAEKKNMSRYKDTVLGLLPFSHIYGLSVISNTSTYRGDTTVVVPKFERRSLLSSVQDYEISTLYIVPPIAILLLNNKTLCDEYNLQSVDSIFVGAAPMGTETVNQIRKMWPKWQVRQAYGMTETSPLISLTSAHDPVPGSSGSLLPKVEARLVTTDGHEVTEYGQPGELLVRCPSNMLGYIDNKEASRGMFEDGWLRTGDEAMVKKSPLGHEHIWITDRIKELIKVKGLQVAPAELEAFLLTHPAVADCAIIPVADDFAGEVPKAYVVKKMDYCKNFNDDTLIQDIKDHIRVQKARHKWLDGGVEFVGQIPRTPSGKILRRVFKEMERKRNLYEGAMNPLLSCEIPVRSEKDRTSHWTLQSPDPMGPLVE